MARKVRTCSVQDNHSFMYFQSWLSTAKMSKRDDGMRIQRSMKCSLCFLCHLSIISGSQECEAGASRGGHSHPCDFPWEVYNVSSLCYSLAFS